MEYLFHEKTPYEINGCLIGLKSKYIKNNEYNIDKNRPNYKDI